MSINNESHCDIFGCNISPTNMERCLEAVDKRVFSGEGGYICFVNVHVAVTASEDSCLRQIINSAFMAVPDGKPIAFLVKRRATANTGQVAGPDFMSYCLEKAKGKKHFFYGGAPETLKALTQTIKNDFPQAEIAGSYSPPFRHLTPEEDSEITEMIQRAKPDIVWVGLGAPKQEKWMAAHYEALRPAVLMGVGAAFDFHAGTIARAPEWMRSMGLEWLHRLSSEPRRLWRRYLSTNAKFLFMLIADAATGRRR